jgi:hypothetical protein
MRTDARECPIVACRECESFCAGTKIDVCGDLLKVVTLEDRIGFEKHKEKIPDWCPDKGKFRIINACHQCSNYVDTYSVGVHECFLLQRYVRGGSVDPECPLKKVE